MLVIPAAARALPADSSAPLSSSFANATGRSSTSPNPNKQTPGRRHSLWLLSAPKKSIAHPVLAIPRPSDEDRQRPPTTATMGCCGGRNKENEDEAARSRELDKVIRQDEKRLQKEVKLLLLGMRHLAVFSRLPRLPPSLQSLPSRPRALTRRSPAQVPANRASRRCSSR